ncbi:sentrin-specific protease 2 [Cyrtonyx montezumae]|uniref:sentrin-specific protease 2 n=1 Tax=Cyrtonyx montezumae TaxID=9017 RepID=UPI0032DBB9C8
MYQWLVAAVGSLLAAARRPAPPPAPRKRPLRRSAPRRVSLRYAFGPGGVPGCLRDVREKNGNYLVSEALYCVTDVTCVLLTDQMTYESSAFLNRVTVALFPMTIPHVSTNRNGEHCTKPAPEDTLTPRPPIKEHSAPEHSTSGAGKAVRPHCAAEEDVQREGKEKYKQLLKLLKEKYAKYHPTPKPTSCSEHPKVYKDEKPCKPWWNRGSYYTPNKKEDKKIQEKQASAGKPWGNETSEKDSSELHLVPVLSPSALDVEEKIFPGFEKRVERFPPLTEAMEREVMAALGRGQPDEVVSSAFKLKVTREDIQTLSDCQWLNDEIINFYMNLLVERNKKDNYPAVYAFSTFFYPKFISSGYGAVRRWTRNVNLFKHDIILIPIHLREHWTLVVVDVRKKTIVYFDSLGKKGDSICETVFHYLQGESWEKQKVKLSCSEWTHHNMESHEIPQQSNKHDCGVFVCKYADYVSRDKPITFTENHMPYFRKRMVWEIIHQQLLSD